MIVVSLPDFAVSIVLSFHFHYVALCHSQWAKHVCPVWGLTQYICFYFVFIALCFFIIANEKFSCRTTLTRLKRQ
ncbi:hypothetical protein L596_021073 [Steinernema carpocapsae]|uniref:Uncharacterized protein n=1 Tax=Steinernema carpocapsae TaxID=34508 RepID=A0A4V6A134_STECR|nr:hypothetical protein L596_021073 [Steinernema carpocapsae]